MAYISVIIPVYKAQDILHELYRRLRASLEPISTDFEIVFVEDCGGDKSWDIIMELSVVDARVKGLKFSRNFGQHYGITAGLDVCTGQYAVVMDCDLQDRPEEIPRLYNRAQEGYDVVLALRTYRKDPPVKLLLSRFFYRIFSYLADIRYDYRIGNFRIISRRVIENFRYIREQLRFFSALVDWMGFPASSIEVVHAERNHGKSTYTFRKLWKLATDTIIAYSDKPLHLSIRFGFTMALLSFITGIGIIVRWFLYGSPVLGWSSIIVSLFFLGGIMIMNLGIIGIYLGKTFDEAKKRPLYIISKRIGL
jgi:glycosyltransferase involved in cell wall biosynthesis